MLLANCTVSILRGTVMDPFGDPRDRDTPVHVDVPASIREVRSEVTTVSEGQPRQVRLLVGRVPVGTDIQHEDRLQDQATGQVYIVDAIDLDASSAIMDQGIRLDLRRVS